MPVECRFRLGCLSDTSESCSHTGKTCTAFKSYIQVHAHHDACFQHRGAVCKRVMATVWIVLPAVMAPRQSLRTRHLPTALVTDTTSRPSHATARTVTQRVGRLHRRPMLAEAVGDCLISGVVLSHAVQVGECRGPQRLVEASPRHVERHEAVASC